MTVEAHELSAPNNETIDKTLAVCEHCEWVFRLAGGPKQAETNGRCPHCRQTRLNLVGEAEPDAPPDPAPELIIPHQVGQESLHARLDEFARSIRFSPKDLTPTKLTKRLEKIYWPMWLVDTDVNSRWEAEIGMDYEVVSHEERFGDGSGWQTREVNETRIRWEPRAGSLTRTYENVAAPALEEHERFNKTLGRFALKSPQAFQPHYLREAHLRMPNRRPEDAWPAAAPALQKAAGEECRQAAGADHIRQFRWAPEYSNQHWTLLLLPLYTTYYLDDEGQSHPLIIHGQTGRTFGRKRASQTRARRTAGLLVLIALLVGLLSAAAGAAGVVAAPLALAGILGIIAAALVGVGAMIPLVLVWQFNKEQERLERGRKPL